MVVLQNIKEIYTVEEKKATVCEKKVQMLESFYFLFLFANTNH